MKNGPITTLRLRDFGGHPDTGEDTCLAMKQVLRAAAESTSPVRVEFQRGRYDFFPANASKQVYAVSNTTAEQENADPVKHIGIHLKHMKDIVIDGSGALLVFHGKMTPIVIDHCRNVEFRNVRIDFHRPTISEMRVDTLDEKSMDVTIHRDSWYRVQDGKLVWVGEGWTYADGPSQAFDPLRNRTWRTWNPVAEAIFAEALAPFRVRLFYQRRPDATVGHVYQLRDGIRDQVGTFIVRSTNVTFAKVHFGYMHGLGIVGQYSEDIFLSQMTFAPRQETGRTAAGFADFVHLSGCRGRVSMTNSTFLGSHDDAINVHGTYLKIVKRISDKTCVVRFMHPQTYGFSAFYPSDDVEFIRPSTLNAIGRGVIRAAAPIDPRHILLEFTETIPELISEGDVIENVSWTPRVEVIGNQFSRIPTRGVLVSTRRPTVIHDNVFEGLQMSAILIAGDAENWFESGMVNDVSITHNRFIQCGNPVIGILPENRSMSADKPVHRNIAIEQNQFELAHTSLLHAKSAKGLTVRHNRIVGATSENEPLIDLCACSDVSVEKNDFSMLN